MDILDDIGVSKLSAKVFLKVNYSFKGFIPLLLCLWVCYVLLGNHSAKNC